MELFGKRFPICGYVIPCDQNGLYGTQEAFGKASFPQNPIKNWVFPTSPGFGGFGGGLPWAPVDLLWALCGPVSYPTPDQPPELGSISR